MSSLRHGYTNRTRRLPGGLVEKRYEGVDGQARSEREHLCLTCLKERLPVPDVIESDMSVPSVILRESPGTHGQDMIEAGSARQVLRLLGSLLVELQGVDPATVAGLPGNGVVIVHGDFGPQNVLIDNGRISAVLDWEFAHVGQPVEDLCWAEWIIRMHHPDQVDALPALFEAARLDEMWAARHAAMVDRCHELLRRAYDVGSTDDVKVWQRRLEVTDSWIE